MMTAQRRSYARLRLLGLVWCLWLALTGVVQAGTLADRMAAFPHWQSKPDVAVATADLIYPNWFQGTWTMTSTLVDLVAPLAPAVTTPGFEQNRQYLNQPVTCQVRFAPASTLSGPTAIQPLTVPLKSLGQDGIVADRAFNGLNLARAYLGDRAVLAVEVDPASPNRQVTMLQGGRQLISVITGRAVEPGTGDRFLTSELFQQVFRGIPQPYLNQVETTTAYARSPDQPGAIVADQMTAIYLSPQDPQYFQSGDQPVALYRYRLELVPADTTF